MPAAVLVPALIGAAQTGVALYGAKKAANAAKLPPAQQAAQDAAAAEKTRRMQATRPLFDALTAGYSQRLPGAPVGNMTGMPRRTPGTMQAVQAMARGMGDQGGGNRNGRIIWGDRRERGGSAY